MGHSASQMNIHTISSIIQCSELDVQNILNQWEGKKLRDPPLPRPNRTVVSYLQSIHQKGRQISYEMENASDDEGNNLISDFKISPKKLAHSINHPTRNTMGEENFNDVQSSEVKVEINYSINHASFSKLMKDDQLNLHPSDVDIFHTLFTLLDKRGYLIVDLRDLLITFSVVVSDSIQSLLNLVFTITDRTQSGIIDKDYLIKIINLLNDTLIYFGDKNLPCSQVLDLVDSVFTSAGRVDGEIYYPDYIDRIVQHPLVELITSPQFQGFLRDKVN